MYRTVKCIIKTYVRVDEKVIQNISLLTNINNRPAGEKSITSEGDRKTVISHSNDQCSMILEVSLSIGL